MLLYQVSVNNGLLNISWRGTGGRRKEVEVDCKNISLTSEIRNLIVEANLKFLPFLCANLNFESVNNIFSYEFELVLEF